MGKIDEDVVLLTKIIVAAVLIIGIMTRGLNLALNDITEGRKRHSICGVKCKPYSVDRAKVNGECVCNLTKEIR